MLLQYCGQCGAFVGKVGPHSKSETWDADAIAAWQAEIDRECQHVPHCRGPWQHAVQKVLESINAPQR